jgi:cytochrome c oxidase subunit IV
MGLYAPVRHRASKRDGGSATCNMFASVCCGTLLGSTLSFVVNCALVEISLNPFFRFYMGIVFMVVGCGLITRVIIHGNKSPHRRLIIFFGALVLLSGVLCFVFEPRWMFTLSKGQRVPLYTLLGMSLAFAVAFAMVDLINFATSEVSFLVCLF